MRVLMLGWEFPPHISGGLGTACYGLTQGLAHHGVEVNFVIPRAVGDEDTEFVDLVGCNQVPVRMTTVGGGPMELPVALPWMQRRAETVAADAGAGAADGEQASAAAPGAAGGELRRAGFVDPVVVDSLLRPYLTEESYARAVDALGGHAGPAPGGLMESLLGFLNGERDLPSLRSVLGAAAPAEVPDGAEDHPAAAAPPAASPDQPGPPVYLHFTGQYGSDLLEEVARYALVVAEIARHGGFDLIHAHDWMTNLAGAAAARVSGRPLVTHVHATEFDRSGENYNPRVKALEQLGLDHADRVVCVSHYTAGVLRKRYRVDPAKLRVVHNAVTHEEQEHEFHWKKNIPEPIVLFLGRVTFQKGPDYFIDAAARVIKLMPEVKFVMSGSGDMLPAMIERAARQGIARSIHFTGFLRGKDVERMYAMADLYVMPSVSEPFGISPLEAMALDVPVIVSNQSGVSEILSNALKFDFWDVEDLANKILALLKRRALREQLIDEGRDEVRRMRWEARAELVRAIYRELVA
ncbi:MAG: glycosyltransferase family 4 protein [Planctomycetes bacterium]|nr:glycosyltransferase family 4 protein [Planctomycetota bacterium]